MAILTQKESDMITMLIEGVAITDIAKKLNITRQTVYKQLKKERKEDLSFYDIRKLMEEGRVYKRTKGGAWRQVR